MLLDDIRNAVKDYAAIGGRQGLQALLGLIRNLNRGMKITGIPSPPPPKKKQQKLFLPRPFMRILVVTDDDVQKNLEMLFPGDMCPNPLRSKHHNNL